MTFGSETEMMKMNKLLKITLMSDLCAATGQHYAAMIDLDTAIDEYGVPFIPSRRLKGCMREIAQYFIDDEKINLIFGKPGQSDSGTLHISDAKIKNHDDFINIPAEKVADYFCSARGETAIENDTAKENSLRYIRVVNQHDKHSKKPLEFFAKIEFDESVSDEMFKIVKALRNIGYHRNRGLGAVKCELIDDENVSFESDSINNDSEYYTVNLTVKNIGDLMLPCNDSEHSSDYISGSMLLGSLAGKYVKKYGDEGFNDIFYSKDVVFSNLYPSFKDCIETKCTYFSTYPAPRFLAKVKAASADEDKGIKNIIGKTGDGKQYKPLKSGYINETYGCIKPDRKIVYHNSNVKSKEQNLFMQYCISDGQYFSGSITATGEKIRKIIDLLSDGVLYFGRSKTVQYARCEVCEITVNPCQNTTVTLKAGSTAAFVLESDTALLNEDGAFTTDLFDLCKALDIAPECLSDETAIASKIISGYNSKWNMKKPHIAMLSAGSCIVFHVADEIKTEEYRYIGEKNNEGFGKIHVITDADKLSVGNKKPVSESIGANSIFEEAYRFEKCREHAVEFAHSINLNSSQIGRLVLMANESKDYDDFKQRIDSIKSTEFKNKAIKYFGKDSAEIDKNADWKFTSEFILTALTVRKYQLRKEEKNNGSF